MVDRRELLEAAALSGLVAGACGKLGRGATDDEGRLLNDVHSQLNPTRVGRIVRVDPSISLGDVVREARRHGEAISIAGGRHAMGGQAFGTATLHLDTRAMSRILAFDAERGLIEVEAGIQWPELIAGCARLQAGHPQPWTIAQKQTGADRMSLGGALASNIHGRGLAHKPFISDVESFTLVDARGEEMRVSRTEHPDHFRLVAGGYGLFGVVRSIRLRLVPRQKLERVVELREVDGLMDAFEERIREGFLYGDFQFEIDPASPTFLTRGVCACYRPLDPMAPVPAGQRELSQQDWVELLELAHTDKAHGFETYARHYLSTQGQVYESDTLQLGSYSDDYHARLDRRLDARVRGTEMISELYVPRAELAGFLRSAAAELRDQRANVIYGTVRLIERDDESFLAWARERWACVVLNLHVEHSAAGLDRARRVFRTLIDLSIARGGSYYLTYHRWATRAQVEACHPRMVEFLRQKRAHDPEERFQSEWYRHQRALFSDVL